MIHYRLTCEQAHDFDGWFRSSTAFDEQAAAGLLGCPVCGSAEVERAVMAPSIVTRGGPPPAEPAPPAAATASTMAAAMPAEVLAMMRKVREYVRANSEYVGDRFPEEARKIHYQEAEARGIFGEATLEEARSLHEEGIELHPLPMLPEDRN